MIYIYIQKGDYDHAMEAISSKMGWQNYNCSKVEIHLCESQPGRALTTKDVFQRGQAIFDLSVNGIAVRKAYGSHGSWIPISQWKEKYAFINIKYSLKQDITAKYFPLVPYCACLLRTYKILYCLASQ